MDRRNGGDPLAPPRPPKLLPRVHRPRAPEPTALSSDNNNSSSSNSNINQQHPSITAASATTSNNLNNLNNLNNNLNNNNIISIIPATADIDDYQIHHLTFLPQRPSSLSRNSSNASSSTATANSSNGSTSSFTRRRPPAPTPTLLNISTAATSGTTIATSNSNSNNSSYNSNISNNSNFLSHFQSAEPALALTLTGQPPASPVTLAQPRPECERLTNEYVDTPLQHATRAQHPAGQQDNGQTTTHHLLLLPQRQQHQQQTATATAHSIGNNRLAATAAAAGSAAAATTTTVDGTDGLLHSTHLHTIPPAQQQHHPHHQQHQQHHHHLHTHLLNGQTKAPASNKFASQAPPAPPRNGLSFAAAATTAAAAATATATTQPITQAITKQPSNNSNSNSSKEHMHALEELLQQQQQQHQQQHQQLPGSGGQLGASIVLGGDPSLLNPIVCPRCGHCRCEQCQSPRPLPQTWVCNKTCLCSAESIIDYASCLCCAKALFYHCARDNDMDCDDGTGTPCVDNPCSCGPYKRTQRWGWLGALSIVLPCLWCYWPMRGCIKLCEKCYARFAGRGCRCQLGGGVGTGIAGNGIGGNSMLPIVPLGGNPNSLTGGVANGAQNGGMPLSVGKGFEHGCSAASRILRKGDLTPEKRLLDSSPDY
ncbi:protein sprouty [Drosophila sulfurigaster albostrigata]|uniref:protein sprouty n=1 Tax=Drosophila sulfurigaster albostrigata TaxID=89887 RepID=UPI002D2186A6|nr:protein sprouty [Drosophila sulfurigaster albostrigata]